MIGMQLASNMARAFCQAIRAAGYDSINYANPDYLNRYFDKAVQEEFPLWLAQWPGGMPSLDKPPRMCDIWQYSDKGSVPGIGGNVDLDVRYGKTEELTDRQKVQKAAGLSNKTMEFLECYKHGPSLLRKLAAAMKI